MGRVLFKYTPHLLIYQSLDKDDTQKNANKMVGNVSTKQYITKDELNKANEKYQEQENAESIQIGGQIYMDLPQEKRNSTYVDTRASLGLLTVVNLVLAALGYFIFQFSVVLTLAVAIVYFIYTFFVKYSTIYIDFFRL